MIMNHSLSTSRLDNWLDCRYGAMLREQGWELIFPALAREGGTLVHHILSMVYAKQKKGTSQARFIKTQIKAWTVQMKLKSSQQKWLEEVEELAAYYEVVLPEYFKYWKDVDSPEWLDFEEKSQKDNLFRFSLLLGKTETVTLQGKRDALRAVGKKKSVWVYDHKTHSRIDPSTFISKLKIATQSKLYALVTNEQYENFKGLVYNVIRGKSMRVGKKETLQQFQDRVYDKIQEDPSHFFFRLEIPFTQAEIKTFAEDIRAQAKEYIAWKMGNLPTYRNGSTKICCGVFACAYLQHCANPTTPIEATGLFERRIRSAKITHTS